MRGIYNTYICILTTLPWRTAQQSIPVFLPEEFHGQKSLVGCSPRDRTELDTTEATEHARRELRFHKLCGKAKKKKKKSPNGKIRLEKLPQTKRKIA